MNFIGDKESCTGMDPDQKTRPRRYQDRQGLQIASQPRLVDNSQIMQATKHMMVGHQGCARLRLTF